MKIRILFFHILFGLVLEAFSQINDDCTDAITLILGRDCKTSIYSNINASPESETVAPFPSCGLYKGGDVWFSMIMPASGALRIETTNLKGATYHSLTVYTGTCGAFTEIDCMRQDGDRTISQPSLAGEMIYLRIFSLNGAAGSEFELCVYEPIVPQNDLCENALLLDVGSRCILENYTNTFATAEEMEVAANPSCEAYQGGDVWFKAIMPASGQLRINKNRGTAATHPSMTIYSGSCGFFEEVLCSKNDATETLNAPFLAGEMIYLRLYSYYSEEGFSFSLCLYEEDAPENDDCRDAISLAVDTSCEIKNFTNLQASAEPVSTAPNPSCGAYKGADVWFLFKVPDSGKIRLETDITSGSAPRSLTLYKGYCNNLEEIACMSVDYEETFFLPDLAGENIYLRAFTLGSDNGGPFSLCVFEPDTPTNDDCENALFLETKLNCTSETHSNKFALTENENIAKQPSCGQFQGGDVWFKTVVPATGEIRIRLESLEGAVDQSITLYSGSCGNFSEITCSQLSGYAFVHDPSLAGETIFIRVFSYGSKEGTGFTICSQEFPCDPEAHDAGEIFICRGNTFAFGSQLLSESGEYHETFLSKTGCDSLVTLSLTVNHIDTTVIQSGSSLVALESGVNYQWIECSDALLPLIGATNQSFEPATPGDYAVILSKNSCIDTSACISTRVLGADKGSHSGYKIYPNPTADIIWISNEPPHKAFSTDLIDLNGRIIQTWEFQKKPINSLHLDTLPTGTFILRIRSARGTMFTKIVKK